MKERLGKRTEFRDLRLGSNSIFPRAQEHHTWPQGLHSQGPLDLVLCINMVHITPWECTQGLFASSSRLLQEGGLLVTYGPYMFDGVISPDSNVRFDASLKVRNPNVGFLS